jgi:hypothetical protein
MPLPELPQKIELLQIGKVPVQTRGRVEREACRGVDEVLALTRVCVDAYFEVENTYQSRYQEELKKRKNDF